MGSQGSIGIHVHDARERTLALVADLEEAQCEVLLLALVHPFRWELGHVAFVYEACVLQLLGQTQPLLVGAEDLYDSFKIDHDDRQQTLKYMQGVLDAVVERLQGHDRSAQETSLYLLTVLHEDMHGEALTYMRQTLSYPAPYLGSTPVQTVPSLTLLVNSKTLCMATLHPTVEGQRDRGCCVKQCSPMLLEIQWPRLNQQSHHFLYSGGAFARLYPANPSPARNRAAKPKRRPRRRG
jgi:hypothetical protein